VQLPFHNGGVGHDSAALFEDEVDTPQGVFPVFFGETVGPLAPDGTEQRTKRRHVVVGQFLASERPHDRHCENDTLGGTQGSRGNGDPQGTRQSLALDTSPGRGRVEAILCRDGAPEIGGGMFEAYAATSDLRLEIHETFGHQHKLAARVYACGNSYRRTDRDAG
jgi:hypothetical protein